ncbi:hypothetical protein GCM10022197_05450 [Microlunatus spumicola]|uniref:Asp23/Gls24 family envelope stress response protein n=1 Tax=Microlunatus spumicola TaxID=81499 RepID=A0ABP6WPJ5_9ACTN
MTQTDTPVRPTGAAPAPAARPLSPAARVQDSATRAATSVDGVHALGSPGGRALVRALGRVPGGRPTYGSGVSVEVGPESVALDLSLVLENGSRAVEVADRVRSAVLAGVARDTGLRVLEVNVTVADLHDPADDVPEAVAANDPAPTEVPAAAEVPDDAPVRASDVTAEPTPVEPTSTPVVALVADAGSEPDVEPDPMTRVVRADRVIVADEVVVVAPSAEEPRTS